jgi:iron uptake system component EfeO
MTAKFVAAYKAGNDDEARAIYPVARLHWERIETIAESFGDLDPKLDLREADLEPGQKWTGWHRLEKDLWPARAKNYRPLSDAQHAA